MITNRLERSDRRHPYFALPLHTRLANKHDTINTTRFSFALWRMNTLMHMDGYGMKIARTTGIWSIELMDGWGLIFFFIVALLILGVTS